MTGLAIIISLLIVFWYFETGGSVRQMIEDIRGVPVRPILKKPKKKD